MEKHMRYWKSEQAEDRKEFALTMMIIGGIGMMIGVLCYSGVIPFSIFQLSKNITGTIVGLIGIFCFLIGIISMKDYKKIVKEVEQEKVIAREVLEWCRQSITKSLLEEEYRVFLEGSGLEYDDDESVLYYNRSEILSRLINGRFMNMDDMLLLDIIDAYYIELYPEWETE